MLKSVMITHNDLDGAGCRLMYELAHTHLRKGEDYIVLNEELGQLDDDVRALLKFGITDPRVTEIVIADCCPSIDVLLELKNRGYKVDIFDHHKTNMYALEVFPSAVVVPQTEMGTLESGTSICYKYYSQLPVTDPRNTYFDRAGNQQLISVFQEVVRLYDTYEWKDKGETIAKELNTLFFLIGMERFCDIYIDRLRNDLENNYIISPNDAKFVEARLQWEQGAIDSIGEKDVIKFKLGQYNAILIMGSKGAPISELGNQWLRKHPDTDIVVGFSFAKGREFSFRCIRDDIDLGVEFAAPLGGGGHPKAAGAPLSDGVYNMFIDGIIKYLNENTQQQDY